MADAVDSKSTVREDVPVQVGPAAPKALGNGCFFLFLSYFSKFVLHKVLHTFEKFHNLLAKSFCPKRQSSTQSSIQYRFFLEPCVENFFAKIRCAVTFRLRSFFVCPRRFWYAYQ